EGDLVVLTVTDQKEKPYCLILQSGDGEVLGKLPLEVPQQTANRDDTQEKHLSVEGGSSSTLRFDEPPEVDSVICFTPRFVCSLLRQAKKLAIWDRQNRENAGDVSLPEYHDCLDIDRDTVIYQQKDGDLVLCDFPSMGRRTNLGKFSPHLAYRFTRDGGHLL